MFFFPLKNFFHQCVFATECNRCNGTGVRIDAHRNACVINFICRMIFNSIKHIGLNITGWANFQMYIFFFKKIKQSIVFCTSGAMSNSAWMKVLQYFSYTVGPFCFACMCCAINIFFFCYILLYKDFWKL